MEFDEHLHPRERDGKFTGKPQTAPEMTLSADGGEFGNLLRQREYPGDSQPAGCWGIDPEDVAPTLAAFGEYVDMFVGSVDEGHLSRGVAGRQRADVARAWAADAAAASQEGDPEIAEFLDGVRRGAVALYGEKVGYDGSLFELEGAELEDAARRALIIAETKRASREERETWRVNLGHATAAEHRGMLVVAAALSGTDRWWGFRDRPRDVMTGDG